MAKIEKIIIENKKNICSSLIGNTIYNGKQLRELCGEPRSKKEISDNEFKIFLIHYLPSIQSFLNGKEYSDNQLLGYKNTVIPTKKLKYYLTNNIPFMIDYHAYGLNGVNGHIVVTYIIDKTIKALSNFLHDTTHQSITHQESPAPI